jgi:hypothetical protein
MVIASLGPIHNCEHYSSVLSRAMITTRPAHKVSKYAADSCGLLVVSCYDHTLPANISA